MKEEIRKVLLEDITPEAKLSAILQVVNVEDGPDDLHRFTEALHIIFCSEAHSTFSDTAASGKCDYYREAVQDNTWSRPCHMFWKRKAETYINNLGIEPLHLPDVWKHIAEIVRELETSETFKMAFRIVLEETTPSP